MTSANSTVRLQVKSEATGKVMHTTAFCCTAHLKDVFEFARSELAAQAPTRPELAQNADPVFRARVEEMLRQSQREMPLALGFRLNFPPFTKWLVDDPSFNLTPLSDLIGTGSLSGSVVLIDKAAATGTGANVNAAMESLARENIKDRKSVW